MADRDITGAILGVIAGLLLLAGLAGGERAWFAASLLVAIAAAGLLVLGPSPEQRAARRRAAAPKYFHARRIR